VVGDIGRDMDAARAAGARGILVPTEVTRPEEVEQAPEVAADLTDVADRVLSDLEAATPVGAGARWSRAMGWSRW
jgi:phosphoglycolate phosphatase-like HAD superfamily hydrolase